MLLFQLTLLTLIFSYSTHPMNMGFLLIMIIFTFSFMTGFLMKTFWFLYILIIAFIGGMLILFIYINSLFPNEKFIFNQTMMIMMIMISISLSIMFYLINLSYNAYTPNSQLINLNMTTDQFFLYTMKMFSSSSSLIITMMVNYLLLCFIIFVKITNFFSGPLRKMN
uniref:NADH dehydrogenase subunit 6 n=1 Tax=Coleoptera sp. 22 KM-2017 TaxID=2219326 RepID=A0A346RIX1_9COLE|nr:NADH dehydrogenase subunit 6 [Coleoptera sp. 22 KM-2017]